MAEDIERALAILPEANAAGVKLLCGDDYGAISLPHGRYADELEFYVKEAGIPALDVIRWATRNGFELMGRAHELGSVREGYLADLLVVDGDPLARHRRPAGPDEAARRHEGRHPGQGRAGRCAWAYSRHDHHRRLAQLRPLRPRRRAGQPGRGDRGQPTRRRLRRVLLGARTSRLPTRSASSSAGSPRSCSTRTWPSRTRRPSASATSAASPAPPPACSRPPRPSRASRPQPGDRPVASSSHGPDDARCRAPRRSCGRRPPRAAAGPVAGRARTTRSTPRSRWTSSTASWRGRPS